MGRRARLIEWVAAEVDSSAAGGGAGSTVRVAVDGVDGAGKTVFADEVAAALRRLGRPVIRAGVDAFHQPRAARYRRGRDSPDGFYLDSYDYPALRRQLLDPLSPGGDGRYRPAAFDYRTDRPVTAPVESAPERAVLVFDGIFLHRDELRGYWDFSVFLRVPPAVSTARVAARAVAEGARWPADPDARQNRRYVLGQRRYLAECRPERHATVVIDNVDLAAPFVVRSAIGRPLTHRAGRGPAAR